MSRIPWQTMLAEHAQPLSWIFAVQLACRRASGDFAIRHSRTSRNRRPTSLSRSLRYQYLGRCRASAPNTIGVLNDGNLQRAKRNAKGSVAGIAGSGCQKGYRFVFESTAEL